MNPKLKPCPACGNQISKTASKCPHCGNYVSNVMRMTLIVILTLAIGLWLLRTILI